VGEQANTRRSYDLVAGRYSEELSGELEGKPLDRALLAAVAELAGGGCIVDVGAGPGHVTGYLASCGSDAIGLDLSPRMCAVGQRATGLPFIAADMTGLPLASSAMTGIVCFYALIHLDVSERALAYREFSRVLRRGGYALVAFHTSDADVPMGGQRARKDWWGYDVDLLFRFLDPAAEVRAMAGVDLELVARMDRGPHPGVEHLSQRSYLLVRRQ
jgi:SAM-dependent methyltransferase